MSKPTRRHRLVMSTAAGLALAAAAFAAPARAQDAAPLSQEQSDSLDRAIGLWTSGLVGGEHGGKYAVTPEGDHYALKIPVGGKLGQTGARLEGDALTATVRPEEERWVFENAHGPESITLVPPPGKTATTLSLVQKAASRTSRVVIDPTLATTSTFDGSASDLAGTISAPTPVSFHADKTTSHGEWRPAGDGQVDSVGSSTTSNVTYAVGGDTPVKVTMGSMTMDAKIAGYAPGRLVETVGLLIQFLDTVTPDQTAASAIAAKPAAEAPAETATGAAPPAAADASPAAVPDAVPAKPGPANKLTAEQRALLHRIIDAARQIGTSLDQTMVLDHMAVDAQGQTVTIGKVSLSERMAAPGGKSDTAMRLAVDEVDSPAIPPPLRQYVPHHLVLAPHVSGASLDDLFAALGRAIDSDDPKSDAFMADAAASMEKNPQTIGLDELSFDFGSSTLFATGLVKGTNPQTMAGTADIKVTGFDALMKRSTTDPLLKQAAPVLIFLKGIGQQDGDTVVWKVVYADRKLTVNGTDMSQILPQ